MGACCCKPKPATKVKYTHLYSIDAEDEQIEFERVITKASSKITRPQDSLKGSKDKFPLPPTPNYEKEQNMDSIKQGASSIGQDLHTRPSALKKKGSATNHDSSPFVISEFDDDDLLDDLELEEAAYHRAKMEASVGLSRGAESLRTILRSSSNTRNVTVHPSHNVNAVNNIKTNNSNLMRNNNFNVSSSSQKPMPADAWSLGSDDSDQELFEQATMLINSTHALLAKSSEPNITAPSKTLSQPSTTLSSSTYHADLLQQANGGFNEDNNDDYNENTSFPFAPKRESSLDVFMGGGHDASHNPSSNLSSSFPSPRRSNPFLEQAPSIGHVAPISMSAPVSPQRPVQNRPSEPSGPREGEDLLLLLSGSPNLKSPPHHVRSSSRS